MSMGYPTVFSGNPLMVTFIMSKAINYQASQAVMIKMTQVVEQIEKRKKRSPMTLDRRCDSVNDQEVEVN